MQNACENGVSRPDNASGRTEDVRKVAESSKRPTRFVCSWVHEPESTSSRQSHAATKPRLLGDGGGLASKVQMKRTSRHEMKKKRGLGFTAL